MASLHKVALKLTFLLIWKSFAVIEIIVSKSVKILTYDDEC